MKLMEESRLKRGNKSVAQLKKIVKLLRVLDWIADLVIISNVVCIVILLNNETSPQVTKWIEIFLDISLVVLFIELGVRMYYKRNFWRTPGDVFDFVVTTVCAVSLMPSLISLRTLRLVRLIRMLRIFSINRYMRLFSEAMVKSLPRVAWSSGFFGMTLLIYAIIGMDSYGATAPEYFGSLSRSLFTLFQVMSLESWASQVARPIMSVHPLAWLYFVSYILIASYILLSLVAGVITATTVEVYEHEESHKDILTAIKKLQKQVDELSKRLPSESDKKE